MSEDIQLRSVKIRKIIGQVPPLIVRIGISMIFAIVALFFIGTFFFKFEETVKTTATITKVAKDYEAAIKIPANIIHKIKSGQQVIFNLDNIRYLYGERIRINIQDIDNKIFIQNEEGIFLLKIVLPNDIKTDTGKVIVFEDLTLIQAEFFLEEINLFEKMKNEMFGRIINKD